MNIDLKQLGADLSAQFQGLQGRPPGLWPLAPRLLCAAGAMAAVLALGWYFYWDSQFAEQDTLAQQETRLRADYKSKMAQAINLDALETQQQEASRYVVRLERQLPSKAEMDALLSDINQAGSGRGLQFQLFKPGQEVLKDYYAERPIDIKVTGSYHDIGEFAADMAKMPRIVTLNNLNLTAGANGVLSLDAVAKTFRYLDQSELEAQAKARKNKKKDPKNKGAKP